MKEKDLTVRFDDKLIYHGSYSLTPRAVKVLCYIIARYINPVEDKQLPISIEIPLTELIEYAIPSSSASTKSNSIYQEIDKICDELTSKIHFSSGVKVDGYELRGYINWCSSAMPVKKDGQILIRFGFDPLMGQFLLGLTQYVRLYRPEINRLRGTHAIRIFQILKGIRNRRAKHEAISQEVYEVKHLKFLLGLKNNYPKFKDFNRWVLKTSLQEINEKTTIKILEIESIKEGRKTTAIRFIFTDQETKEGLPSLPLWGQSTTPKEAEINELPWAQFNAYNKLVAFGVDEGIAFKQIIPTIKGSEIRGYEDHFIEKAIIIFKQKAKQQDAGTFVKWWISKKVFDVTSDLWAVILEDILQYKKMLQATDEVKYNNRQVAMDRSMLEFKTYYKAQNSIKATNKIEKEQKGLSSIGNILNKK
jgi:hypothetical protein